LPAGVSREYSYYCGNYTYDGERFVARVDAASDPSRIGSDQGCVKRIQSHAPHPLRPADGIGSSALSSRGRSEGPEHRRMPVRSGSRDQRPAASSASIHALAATGRRWQCPRCRRSAPERSECRRKCPEPRAPLGRRRLAEWLRSHGQEVVPAGDSSALADALLRMCTRPERPSAVADLPEEDTRHVAERWFSLLARERDA